MDRFDIEEIIEELKKELRFLEGIQKSHILFRVYNDKLEYIGRLLQSPAYYEQERTKWLLRRGEKE